VVPNPVACPLCGGSISPAAPGGQCPSCLLRLGLGSTPRPEATSAGGWHTTPTALFDPAANTVAIPTDGADSTTGESGLGRLGHYELIEEISCGGMGVVYKAVQRVAERVVAVKMLLGRAVGDRTQRDRFEVEARALGQLDHPNIVPVYEVGEDNGRVYFSMEYAPGGSLARRLKDNGPFPAEEAATVVEALAGAVEAAHRVGILHRDIKPGNVLVAGDRRPKLSDFGLAKRTDRDDGFTHTGVVLGTPSFMAPEQAAGAKNAVTDERTDVYGLGATLYALLTGAPPFKADDTHETLRRVCQDDPVPPRSIRPEVPPDLEAVCLKCLEKRPDRRYKTAQELADELARWRRGESTVARPRSWWASVWRAVYRRRRGVAVLATTVAFGIASALVAPMLLGNRPKDMPDLIGHSQRVLAEGKSVTLVGDFGLPASYRWRLTPATLGDSPLADGTCAFQTNLTSMLELHPDPGVDRYRIAADLRQVWGAGPLEPRKGVGDNSVGLYFGADTQAATDGRQVTTLFALMYSDTVPGDPAIPVAARLEDGVIVQKGNQLPGQSWKGVGNVRFKPPARGLPSLWPGEWRRIVVEVAPELVRVYWRDNQTGLLVPIKEWTGDEVRARYTKLQERIDRIAPVSGVAVRQWAPRLALGVWCHHASVALRNVVIEPLP
jgi:serine/threonine-protein kinase